MTTTAKSGTKRLAAASSAIKCVQQATWGTSNKPLDVIFTLGLSAMCVVVQRKLVADPSPTCYKDIPQWITSAAHKLISFGCGNCGEQTAYAMLLLYHQGHRSLDYMSVAGGDHAFLVMGSEDAGPASSFTTWGKDAVVCDPWDGQAYMASQSGLRKAGAKTVYSLCRIE